MTGLGLGGLGRLFFLPQKGLKGFVQRDICDVVRVIADQLERLGDNDLQHLRLGEPGGQEGVQFRLLDQAPLFDDGDGEIA